MEYFFDIPVYRRTQSKYEAEQEARIESVMSQTEDLKQVCKEKPEWAAKIREHYWMQYGGPWQFNEIIGHIRLHFLGTQIRGEWWRVDAKRVTRTRNKTFLSRDWKVVYEEEIPQGSTSKEIYELILIYLKRAQKDKNLKRFHIDTSVFERIGPYVNWKAASKALNWFAKASDEKTGKH